MGDCQEVHDVIEETAPVYTSVFPFVYLTADMVALWNAPDGNVKVLLVERGGEPFKGSWALPGGFVGPEETSRSAAARECFEETNVLLRHTFLRKVGSFSTPGRDPRHRVVSEAFVGVVTEDQAKDCLGGDDAASCGWFNVTDLPELAFDHQEILEKALRRVGRVLPDKVSV